MMVLEPPTIRSLPIHVCNAMMDRGCMPRDDKFAGLPSGITANIDCLVCDPDFTTACKSRRSNQIFAAISAMGRQKADG